MNSKKTSIGRKMSKCAGCIVLIVQAGVGFAQKDMCNDILVFGTNARIQIDENYSLNENLRRFVEETSSDSSETNWDSETHAILEGIPFVSASSASHDREEVWRRTEKFTKNTSINDTYKFVQTYADPELGKLWLDCMKERREGLITYEAKISALSWGGNGELAEDKDIITIGLTIPYEPRLSADDAQADPSAVTAMMIVIDGQGHDLSVYLNGMSEEHNLQFGPFTTHTSHPLKIGQKMEWGRGYELNFRRPTYSRFHIVIKLSGKEDVKIPIPARTDFGRGIVEMIPEGAHENAKNYAFYHALFVPLPDIPDYPAYSSWTLYMKPVGGLYVKDIERKGFEGFVKELGVDDHLRLILEKESGPNKTDLRPRVSGRTEARFSTEKLHSLSDNQGAIEFRLTVDDHPQGYGMIRCRNFRDLKNKGRFEVAYFWIPGEIVDELSKVAINTKPE